LIESAAPIVLLSAGIGATPLLSMLYSLLEADESVVREVWWCYGARNGSQHPFVKEVKELLQRFRNGRSFVAYSEPEDRDCLGKDYDALGHLKLSTLQQLDIPQTAEFYLCGPEAFLADLSAELKSWNVPDSRIHSETFGSGPSLTPGIESVPSKIPHKPQGDIGTGPKVSFTRSGLTVPWDARFGSLLEFAEACDIPVRWSCRVGVCHTCEAGIIDGEVSYAPEPLDRPAAGNLLICCSKPMSEIELDL